MYVRNWYGFDGIPSFIRHVGAWFMVSRSEVLELAAQIGHSGMRLCE